MLWNVELNETSLDLSIRDDSLVSVCHLSYNCHYLVDCNPQSICWLSCTQFQSLKERIKSVTDGLITQLQLQINMEDHWQLLTQSDKQDRIFMSCYSS